MRLSFCLVLGAPLLSLPLFSQSVTTPGGTTNTLAKFSSSTEVVNSALSEINGNVIIGGSGSLGVRVPSTQNSISTAGGINVDQNNQNDGSNFINYSSTYGISFGSTSGEGIGSARTDGSVNKGGLDFYTSFQRRLSISNQGFIGVGTGSPASPLDVNGDIRISSSSGVLRFSDGSTLSTAAALAAISTAGGSIGLNTANNLGLVVSGANLDPNSTPGPIAAAANSWKMVFGWNRTAGEGEQDLIASRADANLPGGFLFYDLDPTGKLTPMARLSRYGLGVGGILAIQGQGSHLDFPDGTTQSTAWTGVVPAQDYADSVEVVGGTSGYEPGDVLTIDPSHPGSFLKTSQPYSTLVGGVYSTKPGVLGRTSSEQDAKAKEVPLALNGIVPTKVSAENGAIHPGDLLVSSSRLGYAMKGTDRTQLTGAVIGKALGSLESDSGVINVLIALQ